MPCGFLGFPNKSHTPLCISPVGYFADLAIESSVGLSNTNLIRFICHTPLSTRLKHCDYRCTSMLTRSVWQGEQHHLSFQSPLFSCVVLRQHTIQLEGSDPTPCVTSITTSCHCRIRTEAASDAKSFLFVLGLPEWTPFSGGGVHLGSAPFLSLLKDICVRPHDAVFKPESYDF